MSMIPFNLPHLAGNENRYVAEAVASCRLSGNGRFTHRCQEFLQDRYGFGKCLLTSSCTDALEMAAILCDLKPGDEVIMPSYTFVSTALAFVRAGAQIVFADSMSTNPCIDAEQVEALVTPRTRVIVPVHYAGIACDMDRIMDIAGRHGLIVVEDAAQAIDSCHKGRALGSMGHMAAFSFHETKNISCGEGGCLAVNDPGLVRRAEIIWEKGTDRAAFERNEVDRYTWRDLGSSFLPSEITAAFLWAQLEELETIQRRRRLLWNRYHESLAPYDGTSFTVPHIPPYATGNGHIYYVVCNSARARADLNARLNGKGIEAVTHYVPLHSSPFYSSRHGSRPLPECDRYADCLLRLPLFNDMTLQQVDEVVNAVIG